MKAEVRRFIRRHQLLPENAPVLVAVSGGVDSVVLLDLLQALGHPCTVAHIDHGLRGEESDGDRAFVQGLCAARGVPCHVRHVEVNARRTKGRSVQMDARTLRLDALRSIAAELGLAHIALGHHRDDALETFLIELMRGGLHTIPVRTGPFIRPLLGMGREAIKAHAREHGLLWREDASNTDPKYLRNRVRHELVPLLEALAPGVRTVLGRTLERARAQDALAADEARRVLATVGDALPLDHVRDPVLGGLLLHHWLRPLGFHPDQLMQLRDAVEEGHVGAVFAAGDVRVTVDREALLRSERSEPPFPFEVAEDLVLPAGAPFRIDRVTCTAVDPEAGPGVAWLDPAAIRFPLRFRPWRAGDRMRPMGLGGGKLVSDILTDAHVPRPRKERTWVVEDGGGIVWLAGHRVAEGYAPGEQGEVLRVELLLA
jgi:tRNA(Ile)-lysidine synthase